jgi:hypothetical protein
VVPSLEECSSDEEPAAAAVSAELGDAMADDVAAVADADAGGEAMLAAGWLWHKHSTALGLRRRWDKWYHALTTSDSAGGRPMLAWYASDAAGARCLGRVAITPGSGVLVRSHHSKQYYFELVTPARATTAAAGSPPAVTRLAAVDATLLAAWLAALRVVAPAQVPAELAAPALAEDSEEKEEEGQDGVEAVAAGGTASPKRSAAAAPSSFGASPPPLVSADGAAPAAATATLGAGAPAAAALEAAGATVLASGWLWHKKSGALGITRRWHWWYHVLAQPRAAPSGSGCRGGAALTGAPRLYWFESDAAGAKPAGGVVLTPGSGVAIREHHRMPHYFELVTATPPPTGSASADSSEAPVVTILAAAGSEDAAVWLPVLSLHAPATIRE